MLIGFVVFVWFVCTFLEKVRNNYLRKVSDVLKKEPTCKDKPVEIVWQQDDRKDKGRTNTVNGQIAFRQNLDDVQGTFLAPFSNLTV